MDLGLWAPSVRDSGWQYTGCWFQLSPHMEDMWHLLAPRFPVTCRLYFQTVQTCRAPGSHSCSAQHGGGGDNMRQSSNGPRPCLAHPFLIPFGCYRVRWLLPTPHTRTPAPLLHSGKPRSAELCTVVSGTLLLIPPFSGSGSLGPGAGEGGSALPFSHGALLLVVRPAVPPAPPLVSPLNLTAEEIQIPQLCPKTSSGALCVLKYISCCSS